MNWRPNIIARRPPDLVRSFPDWTAETMLDERSRDIKRTQIEVVGQYNKVLTALQDAANAMRIAEDLNTRLIAVESKLSLG
ncbi:hypothetical protein ACQKP1_05185 [Allorhizobium sp. NPDC080224]|uniref:hypothetical protein n=1 Tax=Allorhizobium sp. NPDC080224 TaxID=3390547 RepID=UPI003D064043